MPKFRKKPVVIEAVRWRGYSSGLGITSEPADQPLEISHENEHRIKWEPIPAWLPHTLREGQPTIAGEVCRDGDDLLIYTLEGVHRAKPGDWIIRGVQGELYPCKPDIFAQTYETGE